MTNIIAGRFIEQAQAEAAISSLEQAGFPRAEMAVFFVNAPGQHDQFPIGGDEDESPGTEHAGAGAATSAIGGGAIGVAVGLATLPLLGPIAPLAGAGVGAYVGSLAGALDGMNADKATHAAARVSPPEPRKSGMLVAVRTPATARQEQAISVLRSCGASDVEQAEGNIEGGKWADFNPLTSVAAVGR